jgi:hypothetical protein
LFGLPKPGISQISEGIAQDTASSDFEEIARETKFRYPIDKGMGTE